MTSPAASSLEPGREYCGSSEWLSSVPPGAHSRESSVTKCVYGVLDSGHIYSSQELAFMVVHFSMHSFTQLSM